jgi:hypothetical protein
MTQQDTRWLESRKCRIGPPHTHCRLCGAIRDAEGDCEESCPAAIYRAAVAASEVKP